MQKYLNLIEDINQKYKDIIVIGAVETNPFYFWSGNFLKGTLILNNRNKDMLVIGLGNADDYKNMPSVINHNSKFDAYHGDKFTQPYQDLIDYVTEKGGLIFWSHPEYEENVVKNGIRLITAPYEWDLVGTYNYTGFGIFWEGYAKTGRPTGIWDRVLTDYCNGRRKSPVWVIGELEEEGTGDKNLDDVVNVLYVKELNRKQILDSIKRGRFYVTYKEYKRPRLALEEFAVIDGTNSKTAIMGEEVYFSSAPVVKVSISSTSPADRNITVKLIKNNKIIKESCGKSHVEMEYADNDLTAGKKYYYRIDAVDQDNNRLVSNPIFIKKL